MTYSAGASERPPAAIGPGLVGGRLGVSIDKDIWSGIFFMALGSLGLHFGADYAFGTTARMGPGFLPKLLCMLLVGVGIIVFLIGLARRTDVMEAWAWGPLAAISCSVLAFGAVLEPIGLELAIIASVIVGAVAVPSPNRLELTALTIACIAFTVLLVPSPLHKLLGTMLPWIVAVGATAVAVVSHVRHTSLPELAERLALALGLAVLAVVVFVDALGLAMKSLLVLPVWLPVKQVTVVPFMRLLRAIFEF